jgi:hypothetical protein
LFLQKNAASSAPPFVFLGLSATTVLAVTACGARGAPGGGDLCVPITCESARAECGALGDGCGAVLQCGSCGPGAQCGAVSPNVCTPSVACTTCGCPGVDCGGSSSGGSSSGSGSSSSGSASSSGGPGDDGGTVQPGLPVRSIALATNDLVFDPVRRVLYATVPSAVPTMGNGVAIIDPATATVTGSFFVGGDPRALAISDDASSLYVGVDGVDSVCHVDLPTLAVDAPVSLGSDSLGPRIAQEIRVVPGASTRYLVSRRDRCCTPGFAGLALFSGTKQIAEWTGRAGRESVAFVDASNFFGYNNSDTGFDLYRFTIDGAGIHPVADNTGALSGFAIEISYQGGWLFGTNGQAVSAATTTAVGSYSANGPLWADSDERDVWFLQAPSFVTGRAWTLVDFDRSTFFQKRSLELAIDPSTNTSTALPSSLIHWSPNGFAFRTTAALYFVDLPSGSSG